MSTAKNAVAVRIRNALALPGRAFDLPPDVRELLAESAVLLEVQCESEQAAIQVAMMALGEVSRLVAAFSPPPRDHATKPLVDYGTSARVDERLEHLVLRQLRAQGADTPEKVSDMLKAMGADPEICARVVGCAAASDCSSSSWAGWGSAPFSRNGT